MTEEEINKIIAEFMGAVWCEDFVHKCKILTFSKNKQYNYNADHLPITKRSYKYIPNYTQSLDALIPVVEKLPVGMVIYASKTDYCAGFLHPTESDLEYMENYTRAESPSLALATACVKVIKELE